MAKTTKRLTAILCLAVSIAWVQPVNAQVCSGFDKDNIPCSASGPRSDACLGFIDLNNTSPAVPLDLTNPEIKFTARRDAAIQYGVCQRFDAVESCGGNFGENYQTALFARLASGDPALQQQAIDSLRNVQRSDFGAMGTDSPASGICQISGLLKDLTDVVSNAARQGDGDTAMIGFVNVLYRFKGLLQSAGVFDHVLSLIDLSPGRGGVESLSYGLNTVPVCAAVCLATSNPFVCAGCLLVAEVERVTVPETENHLNLIYVSQYLANQLWLEKTGDPKYDNARNGYRALLINRMKDFVRNDFIEYNSHPYEDFTTFALLSLYSYAADPTVQDAAKMALDYVSAKVAVSSNDGRRSTPFRRRNESGHTCDELVLPGCSDPHTAFYMMLAGVTDILENAHDMVVGGKPLLPQNNNAPASYGVEFMWAATTDYRIDPLMLDLLVDRSHRSFYQFFHYSKKLPLADVQDSNDELYFGSPSYLISAGGHGTQSSYTADVPFPFSLITGGHPGNDVDRGFAPPTTVMPTGDFHSREQMIRFDPSLCVAPNFACGTNPVMPDFPANPSYKTVHGPTPATAPASGSWTFVEYSSPAAGAKPAGKHGFYAAVYRSDPQGGFGFVEVYDTSSNPKNIASLGDFETMVHANNDGKSFSQSGTNTYKTVDGTVIASSIADGKISSVNGKPPYDPNRTNGTIINNDGRGLVTINNPALGKMLTLDATAPPSQPQITVPGPLTFPNTCVGSKSLATLNVCNDGNGTDDLFVYNILSLSNTQFKVTEPTSGYPTTLGSNFCFPFQAQFAPVMTGTISSKLTLSSSDSSVPELKLDVSGDGIQQGIATVISNSGNFGDVCIGSFTDLNLTINNTGGCDLVVTNIASSSATFTVARTLSFPLTIHAGDSLAVPIRFHPSAFGAATGNITVTSNDPKAPSAIVAVSGNAPPPAINATIANGGSFGNVCAGTQADLTLQVMNQGQCNLTITSINAMGLPSFVLPSVTSLPVVLAANSSVNLPIRFQPAAYGSPGYLTCSDTTPQGANIIIHSNDPNYPDPTGFVRAVNGIEGCPRLVLSPKDLTGAFAFPATVSDPVGNLGCSTDRQTLVTNSGICPLIVASLTAGPSNAFNVMNPTVPLSIAPGAAPVPVTVRFRPINLTGQLGNAPDQQTGSLTIVSNDPTPSHNGAALCGEPAYHSGIRVLVVNEAGQPVNPLKSLSLSSKGLHPNINQTLSPAVPVTAPSICGNAVTYTLDNETLPPAGTTGNSPLASYSLSAKQGSTQANLSFSLGQCEMKQVIMQIK